MVNSAGIGVAVTLLLLAPADAAYGLGIRLPNQDPEAIARGNALVATASNPSAVYYNPAGISQLEGHNAQLGIYSIFVEADHVSPGGERIRSKGEWHLAPQMFYSYRPNGRQWAVGFGLYAPFGLGMEWPERSPFRTGGIEGRLDYLTSSLVLAWEIHPTLFVAAGPALNWSSLKLRQGIGLLPMDEFSFRGEGFGLGANIGFLWKPHSQWSLGASYRSPTTINYDGRSEATPFAPRQDTSVDFRYPQFATVGVSFRPAPDWNLEFNFDWTDWSRLNTAVLRDTFFGDVPLTLNWRTSHIYKFGLTREFGGGFWAGTGYFFATETVPDETFNPLIPDTELHVVGAGVGKRGSRWSWAFATQHGFGPWRTVEAHSETHGRWRSRQVGLTASMNLETSTCRSQSRAPR